MEIKCVVVVFVALLVVSFSDVGLGFEDQAGEGGSSQEHKGQGRFDEHERNRTAGDKYSWTRVLADGSSFRESAFVPANDNIVTFRSKKRSSQAANVTKSDTTYEYRPNSTNVVAITVFEICYITDTLMTKDETVALLDARNGTNVTTAGSKSLNGVATPIGDTEKSAFCLDAPGVCKKCGQRQVVKTVPDTNLVDDDANDIVTVYTLTDEVKLLIPHNSTTTARPYHNHSKSTTPSPSI
ncbi:uncharacterized protein LOC131928972 [Physella acuta]|uniref:uncharacterized protein LOC131928972 n=1 Tax=Physella acuta TaxID=109671 RepID=UPI0027DE9D5E|nr:uncharacterized protein LOC131928972 [Physella acuta]